MLRAAAMGDRSPESQDVTRLLHEWRAGKQEELERLIPLVYAELRSQASRYLSHVAEMAAITTAGWMLFTPPDARRERRLVESVLAGLFFGIAAAIRPVTAIGLGLSLWLWLLSSRGWSATRATLPLLALVLCPNECGC